MFLHYYVFLIHLKGLAHTSHLFVNHGLRCMFSKFLKAIAHKRHWLHYMFLIVQSVNKKKIHIVLTSFCHTVALSDCNKIVLSAWCFRFMSSIKKWCKNTASLKYISGLTCNRYDSSLDIHMQNTIRSVMLQISHNLYVFLSTGSVTPMFVRLPCGGFGVSFSFFPMCK